MRKRLRSRKARIRLSGGEVITRWVFDVEHHTRNGKTYGKCHYGLPEYWCDPDNADGIVFRSGGVKTLLLVRDGLIWVEVQKLK